MNPRINHSDFVHIPGVSDIIAKEQGFNGFNWEKTHYKLAKNGLYMSSPRIFMPHYLNVLKAHKEGTPIYDGNGNRLTKKDINALYEKLSSDCWAWLDALFNRGDNNWFIKSSHRVVDGKLTPQTYEPLEKCVMDDCHVKLQFNNQGLPITKAKKPAYEQGKNIYFYFPRENTVARFNANSDGASLNCGGYPANSNSGLGVFACAEGAQKISEVYSITDIKKVLKEKCLTGIESILTDGLNKLRK